MGSADDALVIRALADLGHDVRPVIWTSPEADWPIFDVVVVRSTWDYVRNVRRFRRWLNLLEDRSICVANPVGLMRWNLDKHYLLELSDHVPIATTHFVDSPEEVGPVMTNSGWSELIIKPCISCDALLTERLMSHEVERAMKIAEHIRQQIGCGVMMQPLFSEIINQGEWSFVFINGAFCHAVLKQPAHGDFRSQPDYGANVSAVVPSSSMLEQAKSVLAVAPARSVYARVDAVNIDRQLHLMELELIEPCLYLQQNALAPQRFANAIAMDAGRQGHRDAE